MSKLFYFKTTLFLLSLFILSSCNKNQERKPEEPLESILVLGNSITIHPLAPQVGWNSHWGMAASKREADFIHQLAAQLKVEVIPYNVSAWEREFQHFPLETLLPVLNRPMDVIILRLGENVQDSEHFSEALVTFIHYIEQHNPKAKLLISGTFWQNDQVNNILQEIAYQKNIPFVSLQHLDQSMYKAYVGQEIFNEDGSINKISNQGVADHPNDLGMQQIANLLAEAVKKLYE